MQMVLMMVSGSLPPSGWKVCETSARPKVFVTGNSRPLPAFGGRGGRLPTGID
jgi:hypothetical protein